MMQTIRALLTAPAIVLCLTPIAHTSPDCFAHAKFVPLDARENHELGYSLEIYNELALVGSGIEPDIARVV